MAVIDKVGYSETTLQKQEDFIKIFRMLCSIWKGTIRQSQAGNQILYFDLNAGHGIGHKIPIVGSPVIAAMTLKEFELPHLGFVCEVYHPNVLTLTRALMAYSDFQVVQGDNRNALIKYLPKANQSGFHYGLVYADPNNYPISEFNFLKDFGLIQGCSRLDVLISFSATTIKRTDNAHADKHNLSKYLQGANKKKWYIRKLMDGHHHWSFLFGTNWRQFPDYFCDFYTLNSPEGQEILEFFYNKKNGRNDIQSDANQISLL
jgi:hypothetical protein